MSEVKEVPIKINGENYSSLAHSNLTLFNGLPTKSTKKRTPSKKVINEAINHGFVFSPQVAGNYTDKELLTLIDIVSNEIGLTPEQMNSSFNHSWKKVRDAPITQLVFEQLTHYMTTYGYEAMGTFDQNTVFVPNEKLDIPTLDDGVTLTVIHGYTKKQLKTKLLNLLNSGIALDNIDEITTIANYVVLTDDEVLTLRNKEVRVRLYKELDLIPADPVELLRLAVFEATERTLLIVNKGTIETIKGSETGNVSNLFMQYDENFGYKHLAEIFQRFKPLFLAFKEFPEMRKQVNLISHLSGKYHKTMPSSLLNGITAMLSRGDKISPTKLNLALDRANIWRKIRLAQGLKYRMTGNKAILYKIRNGKAFAKTMEFDNFDGAKKVYDIIIKSISKDLKHLKGKEFYIPENLTYSLPSTAKQFSGNIPTGSYVTCGKDMIFGVWWENQEVSKSRAVDHNPQDEYGIAGYGLSRGRYSDNDTHNGKRRIDLDLHVQAMNAGHIGWNTTQRSGNRSVLRTGDIVDAPNGAIELFYINKDYEDTMLVTLNYFNFDPTVPVPFKFIVADEHPNSFGAHYTINPNNMKFLQKQEISVNQIVLGLATVKDGECRFYFNSSGIGNTNVVKGSEYMNIARNYLAEFSKTQITFNEIVEKVGAKIVRTKGKKSIDLSPENLQKDTFINLLINTK